MTSDDVDQYRRQALAYAATRSQLGFDQQKLHEMVSGCAHRHELLRTDLKAGQLKKLQGLMGRERFAVLSWRLSNTTDASFCVAALEEALARYGKPEIFNTDQGSQFTSADFTGVLIEADVRISMDGRGRWIDNVFIERVWRSLKYEDAYLKGYADGREAKAGISDWIIFYNEQRLHQALGYRAPMAVRERAPPKAYGHVDNANALTTCPRRIRNSRHNPWRLDKGQPADALPT